MRIVWLTWYGAAAGAAEGAPAGVHTFLSRSIVALMISVFTDHGPGAGAMPVTGVVVGAAQHP